jgi:maleylacetoacetate isomerase
VRSTLSRDASSGVQGQSPWPSLSLLEDLMILYEYFRSSASYRMRIALNLKGLSYDIVQIHLLKDEQFSPWYRALNPQARVPTLVGDDGLTLIQSPAILEWLDETHPEPAFLPHDAVARARIRAMAALIGCDIHPLNNSGVMVYLRKTLGLDESAVSAWYAHWITLGFTALEQMVAGPYCAGETLSLADIYLVPQVANARRMNVDLAAFPKIVAIDALCLEHKAFADARPEVQKVAAV